MKQVSQNYKTGAIRLADVQEPALGRGGVLVRTAFSVISAGTEGMKVQEGKMSYLQKAKARPDQVRKVVQAVQQQGLMAAYQKVMNKLDSLTPLGYSLSGVVAAVGEGAEEFAVGQRVACAGAGYANHAEINFIPRNLVVPVPDSVPLEHAAFATIGAIALQGLRQAQMQLGENACVIGLGLIGQILVQLLRASGVQVVGIDLMPERCALAMQSGAAFAGGPDDPTLQAAIHRLSGGAGIDCIFLCAGGNSNKPVEAAVQMARDRARVVDIGKTRLDLPWKDYYEKELDVRFSRSYGPGRYDPNYEERGIDYPIGYVRWTERRNMASFIDLLADGKLKLDAIVTDIRPFAEAEQVYEQMAEGKTSGLGIVFRYESPAPAARPAAAVAASAPVPIPADRVRLGVIGAGNYASSMLLPHLAAHPQVALVEVATRTSLSAANAARKFNFARTGTDYHAMLKAPDVDAVLIATRHATHAAITADALRSGKPVFVEKPLAIRVEELEQVRRAAVEAGNDRLQVGFNRRFAPLVLQAAERLAPRAGPLMIQYRVHAGRMESTSWYLDASEGSRFAGEGGHFIDTLSFLIGSRPVSVHAAALRPASTLPDDLDNVAVTLTYEDGSVASLLYLTQGGAKVPKEFIEIFGGGRTLQLHNFEHLLVYDRGAPEKLTARGIDKGQAAEMRAFVEAIRQGGPMPIPFDSLLDTTLATLAVGESLRTGRAVPLASFWC